jgi:hypothetical protein
LGINRIDARDVAKVAFKCLAGDFNNEVIELVGSEEHSAREIAIILSQALNTSVLYSDDLGLWLEKAKEVLPKWNLENWNLMYQHFQEKGYSATGEQIARTEQLLGRKTRSYLQFVLENIAYFNKGVVEV